MSLTWDANAKFFATSYFPLQFVYHQITYFCLITMARVKTGFGENSSTGKRGLAARAVVTKAVPSYHHVQSTRARKPPTYLTQDQNKEVSRLHISATAATNPAEPRNVSKDNDNIGNDKDQEGQQNDSKDDDGGEAKQGGQKGGRPN